MFDAAEFPMPEDLGQRCAQALLDEVFVGGVVDSNNQAMLLLLTAVSSGDAISQIKLGRVTEQSVTLLRLLKQFFNLSFRIEQCQDDVYSDDDEDDEEQSDKDNDGSESNNSPAEEGGSREPVKFPQTFIFSCIGLGLTNFARKQE